MDLDRRTLLALASTAAATPALAQAADPTETLKLWPGRPPGALAALPREVITDRTPTSGFQDRYVTGIGEPLLTVFRPAGPNGAACVIAPGGGYIRVVIDKEGFEIARRLAESGVTSFVLRYRLPAEGWASPSDTPLQDAQRAVRLVRAAAPRYGVDPARVAFLGCSAGGHLAASLATGYGRSVYAPVDDVDRLSARPDLSGLLYPVIDMSRSHAHGGSRTALLGPAPSPQAEAAYSPHRQVTAETPPTFLVHAADDHSVPVENSLNYLSALHAANVPAEAHIFEEGGHGFGIYLARGKPAHGWPDLFLAWAARRGWLKTA